MSDRNPTPQTDNTWSRYYKTHTWHLLWQTHLQQQMDLNPNHPAHHDGSPSNYDQAATEYAANPDRRDQWHKETDQNEQKLNHELFAALATYNHHANESDTAHLGLTSSDITDVTTQHQIYRSLNDLADRIRIIGEAIAQLIEDTPPTPILARTHGQPAQPTIQALRYATILAPLTDLRNQIAYNTVYPMRPPHGAVGTAADLTRILNGWGYQRPGIARAEPVDHEQVEAARNRVIDAAQAAREAVRKGQALNPRFDAVVDALVELDQTEHPQVELDPPADHDTVADYTKAIAGTLGLRYTMVATRQTYHRMYDIPVVAAVAQFAMVARTWGTDRRLETLLGHGHEQPTRGQVGSSAMPHKANPIYAERMVSLANYILGMVPQFLTIDEWLESDIAGSTQRRKAWPVLFEAAEELTNYWMDQIERWCHNHGAARADLEEHIIEASTGAFLQYLVEQGLDRTAAHDAIRETWRKHGPDATTRTFRLALLDQAAMADHEGGEHDRGLQQAMNRVLTEPPGISLEIVKTVLAKARD